MKISYNWHLVFYLAIVILLAVEYQRWLNPLSLKPEANPKQHDGSREFTPPQEWRSSIEPMPDEDGVRRYLDPYELYKHGKDSEKELDLKIE